MTYTQPDEYSAQQHDVEAADEAEESSTAGRTSSQRRAAGRPVPRAGPRQAGSGLARLPGRAPRRLRSSLPGSRRDDPNASNLSDVGCSRPCGTAARGRTRSAPTGRATTSSRRLLYGARTSLFIGIMVVLLAGTFGVLVGLLAGYKGGRIDRWLMGWVDVQVSFPGLLLAMLLIALVGGSITYGHGDPRHQRMDGLRQDDPRRGAVGPRSDRSSRPPNGRLQAASGSCSRTSCPTWSPRWRRSAVLEFARIILAEAALSFLGLGIQYPGVSWGLDIGPRRRSRAVRQPMADHLSRASCSA